MRIIGYGVLLAECAFMCLRQRVPPNALDTFAFEGDLAPCMRSVFLSVKSTVDDLQKRVCKINFCENLNAWPRANYPYELLLVLNR